MVMIVPIIIIIIVIIIIIIIIIRSRCYIVTRCTNLVSVHYFFAFRYVNCAY